MTSVQDAEAIMASDEPASDLTPKVELPPWIAHKLEDAPKLDLETYISNYSGPTRLSRLLFIGSVSSVLAPEALALAVHEARAGMNVDRYKKAVRALAEVSPEDKEAILDQNWIFQTRAAVKSQTERLELELKGYKNNLIKESIRMGHEDLGNHYFQTGQLSSASFSYTNMREYCTTARQIESMYFKLLITNLEAGKWRSTLTEVSSLRDLHLKRQAGSANSTSKMLIAEGLARLNIREYHAAAKCFLEVTDSVEDFNMTASVNDIAIYGVLCALATMPRDQIKLKVMDSSSFQVFLDLEPQMRRAVHAFYNSKFHACFRILTDLRTDFLLDIHLSPHITALFDLIRLKAFKQYMIPFSCVTFKTLATVFSSPSTKNMPPTTPPLPFLFIECPSDPEEKFRVSSTLIKELAGLISRKDIDYHLNMETQTLDHNHQEERQRLVKEFRISSEKMLQELYWRATTAQSCVIQGWSRPSSRGHDELSERINSTD